MEESWIGFSNSVDKVTVVRLRFGEAEDDEREAIVKYDDTWKL